jgi:hypothetical protein
VTVVYFQGDGAASRGELRLQHGTQPSISRFVFPDQETFDLPLSPLGLDTPFSVGAIVGASPLRHFSLTFRYDTQPPQLTFSDQIPDSKSDLAEECDVAKLTDPVTAANERCEGTFNSPVVGGGMVRIGDGELVELSATRMVLPVCLQPEAFDPTKIRLHGAEVTSGVAAMAVVATGIGTSVITKSALTRLVAVDPNLKVTAGSTLYLAYGQEAVSTVELERAAVVSNETDELNACGELALRRRMLIAALKQDDLELIEEKSIDGASVGVSNTAMRFAVIDDNSPLIQGLRKELQPQVADIDVVLGGSFLKQFDVLVDYPSSRVILRCNGSAAQDRCRVFPWCSESKETDPRCPGLPD